MQIFAKHMYVISCMYLSNCRPGMCYCVIPICKQIAELNNQIEYVPLPVSLTLKKVEIVHSIWFFFAIFLITFLSPSYPPSCFYIHICHIPPWTPKGFFLNNNCVKACHFQIQLEIPRISWHWNYKSASDWNSDEKKPAAFSY